MMEPPSDEPNIVGTVVAVERRGPAVEVRVSRLTADGVDDVLVHIGGAPVVARAPDGLHQYLPTDVSTGQVVAVWDTGVELRSLPPQYFARFVEIRNPTFR
jgi:hypothetical protein